MPKESMANSLLALLQGHSSNLMSNKRMSKEEAYEYLKNVTMEDFGYDVERWRAYFAQHDFDTAFKGSPRYNIGKPELSDNSSNTKHDSESSE